MTPRDRRTIGSLVLTLAVVAGAVAIPGAPPPAESGATAAPTEGWTTTVVRYREGIVGGWTSVTPISARTAADRQLAGLVFSGLVRLGPGQELAPALATSWTAGDEGRRWTFTLDPAARWQDGVPVTASDVTFTFQVLSDPAYVEAYGASWQEVKVSAPDPATVVFEVATPLGGLLQALTQGILPKHLLAGRTIDEIAAGPFASAPVGTGPYRLASIDEERAELVRVAAPQPTPGVAGDPIDELEMRFYPDPAALLAAYRSGEVDGAVGLGAGEIADAGEGAGTVVRRYPTATLTAVVPNLRGKSAFKNSLVRGALARAIDRDDLVASVMGGEATRADGLIPASSWAYSAEATPPIAFDRSAATALLRKAGWTEGSAGTPGWIPKGWKRPLALALIAPRADVSPLTFGAAEQVADAWRALGFAVTLEAVGREELAARLQSGNFMLAVVAINIGLDPDLYPFLASSQVRSNGSNVAGIQNAPLDKLLVDARRPGSSEQRRARYRALQDFLSETTILVPLCFASQAVVTSGRLDGPVPREIADPGDRYWDVLTWRLADGR